MGVEEDDDEDDKRCVLFLFVTLAPRATSTRSLELTPLDPLELTPLALLLPVDRVYLTEIQDGHDRIIQDICVLIYRVKKTWRNAHFMPCEQCIEA
jgi:hypothetical protein